NPRRSRWIFSNRVKVGSSSTRRTRILSTRDASSFGSYTGHDDASSGAAARPVRDSDRASMQRDDGLADREAEAGSLPRRLGREERIEDLGLSPFLDPRAGIFDLHHDGFLQPFLPRSNGQRPAAGHRVNGVDEQIDEDLLELVPV